MKTYLGLLCLLLVGVVIIFIGLTITDQGNPDRVGSEAWCEAMVLKPNKAWTDAETRDFAASCLYE